METNADSLFLIGSTHTTCQDYCCHSLWNTPTGTKAFIAVCDGCSSSPKSDIGARLLGENALKEMYALSQEGLQGIPFWEALCQRQRATLPLLHNLLGLSEKTLDATLLCAWADPATQTAEAYIQGDGTLALLHKDNTLSTLEVSYPNNQNAPFYPSYKTIRPQGKERYIEEFGAPNPLLEFQGPPMDHTMDDEGRIHIKIPLESLQCLALTTDGASSFLKGTPSEHVPTQDILQELNAFKSFEGKFVERRLRKALKTWKKENTQHTDDLGLAAIAIHPPA